jgi:hypothetical protein
MSMYIAYIYIIVYIYIYIHTSICNILCSTEGKKLCNYFSHCQVIKMNMFLTVFNGSVDNSPLQSSLNLKYL